ncbi:MAG: hypothetical protein N5P05_002650 [Chroococcopsis gigantea SAG 12.99]|nr:hypothetical protein [Chroococcopsis gigantea SAG 12.99]
MWLNFNADMGEENRALPDQGMKIKSNNLRYWSCNSLEIAKR